jgi:hypothetical protein
MKEKVHVNNMVLQFFYLQLHSITTLFSQLSFTHIPREPNSVADALSKDALVLNENQFIIEEYSGGLLSDIVGDIFEL